MSQQLSGPLTDSASRAWADGFPEVAIRIGADAGTTQFFDPRPERLVNSFVLGRDTPEGDLLLRCAMLLAAFRVLRVEPAIPAWPNPSHTQTTQDCLAPVAALGRSLTWEDLHAAARRLKERGVLKRRGGLGSIQPRPIAIRLAERQWREWDRGKMGPGVFGRTRARPHQSSRRTSGSDGRQPDRHQGREACLSGRRPPRQRRRQERAGRHSLVPDPSRRGSRGRAHRTLPR